MAELERLANHFGDIGAICNDAAFALMHAQMRHVARTRACAPRKRCFGHRLMMDAIVPGGVARDLAPEGAARSRALLAEAPQALSAPGRALRQHRLAAGPHRQHRHRARRNYARQFGAGGFVGRASGRDFDARRALAYAPYDALDASRCRCCEAGDVNARVWVRIREVEQSLSLIEQILERLPDGAVRADVPSVERTRARALALVEAFRGDVLVWLRLDATARVARCHLRDASWFQWPLLEAAIEGNIVADFPLCNKSFNCSYSGHDL